MSPNRRFKVLSVVFWLALPVIFVALSLSYLKRNDHPERQEIALDRTMEFKVYYNPADWSPKTVKQLGRSLDRIYRYGWTFMQIPPQTTLLHDYRYLYLAFEPGELEVRRWFWWFGIMMYADSQHPHIDESRILWFCVTDYWSTASPFFTYGTSTMIAARQTGRSPHLPAAALLSAEPAWTIEGVLKNDSFSRDRSVNKVIAASFFSYLIDTYGLPAFRTWYQTVRTDNETAAAEFKKAYGVALPAAQQGWRKSLASVRTSDLDGREYAGLLRRQEQTEGRIKGEHDSSFYAAMMHEFDHGAYELRQLKFDEAARRFDRTEALLVRSERRRAMLKVLPYLFIAGLAGIAVTAGALISRHRKKAAHDRAVAPPTGDRA